MRARTRIIYNTKNKEDIVRYVLSGICSLSFSSNFYLEFYFDKFLFILPLLVLV